MTSFFIITGATATITTNSTVLEYVLMVLLCYADVICQLGIYIVRSSFMAN